jgi:oligopeptidase A
LDFQEEELRPYFEQKKILKGVFEYIQELFGVQFVKLDMELWHPKAEAYMLYDNSQPIGQLFIDLEARKGKRGGAWMSDWHRRHIDSKSETHLPSAFVVCNFPPSNEKTPSLLRHDDVHTFLHEMGHAIHHLFSKVNEYAISGTNVEWDAVEFPSQFLENFAFDRGFLNRYAKHFETGEALPNELIDKIIENRNFQSALMMVRQLEFGLFDFMLHMNRYDVQELLDEIRERISPLQPPRYNKFQNSFTHIFAGGYAAGYYSYKWAEVLSADLFLEVLKDSSLAEKFKTEVLEKGGSASMSVLFKNLMGREPNPDALLKLSGIL